MGARAVRRGRVGALLLVALAAGAGGAGAQENGENGDPAREAELARADSLRAALVQPPGDKGLSPADVIRAPFQAFGAGLALVAAVGYGAYELLDESGAIELARDVNRDLGAVDIRLEPDFIGSRSWPALVARWEGARPLFLEGGASLRGYTLARAGLTFGDTARGLEVAGTHHRMNQLHFWGAGPDSEIGDRSDYALTRMEATGSAWTRLAPNLRVGLVGGVEENDVGRGKDDKRPDLQDVFAGELPFGATGETRFARGGASVDADFTRVVGSYQLEGARLLVDWSLYEGLGGTDAGFQRVSADARMYAPVTSRHGFAVRGLATDHFGESGAGVPFHHLAALGDDDGLRGYSSWRFRDRALVSAMAEWRYVVFYHPGDPLYRVQGFAFVDHGAVGSSLGDIGWGDFRTTPGLGIRLIENGKGLFETFVAFGGEQTRVDIEVGVTF